MKRVIQIGLLTVSFIGMMACSTALKSNGVAISTVNGAMTEWGIYTKNNKVTDAQILTVSNAYVLYYNSELIASNAWIISVQQTNNTFYQSAQATAVQSETNLINIINVFLGDK